MRCGERPRRYGRGPRVESSVPPTGAGSDSPRSRTGPSAPPTGPAGGVGAEGAGVAAGGCGAGPDGICDGPGLPGTGEGPGPTVLAGGPFGFWATSRPGESPPEGVEGPGADAEGERPARAPAGAALRPRETTCARPSELVRGAAMRSVGGREGPEAIWVSEPRPPSPPPPAATTAIAPRSASGAMSDTPAARASCRPQSLVRPITRQW